MAASARRPPLAALIAPLLLAACTVGPNYQRPPLAPTAGYGAAAAPPANADGGPTLVAGADVPGEWWQVYHCAELDQLVALALKHNATIDAARAALRAAQEQVRAQRGADYPQVTGSLQPTRQKFANTLASPLQSGIELYSLTTTQLSVSYSPDLFGANRRAVESLQAQADQQRFELEAARLTLASNVVVAAIQDALLRAEIGETKAIIDDQQRTVASFQLQLKQGQAATTDLAAQQALLAQAQAALPPLQKQFRINRDLLAALVGRTPDEPVDVRFDLAALTLPDKLPLSLPAQLVEHRPDVRIAEAQLHAASAQIGVAKAARLPNIELAATAGSAALALNPAFGPESDFWSLAAMLTQPIYDGGILLHRQRAAEAAYDQAAAQYQGAVVGAFQNTADALHAIWTDGDAVRDADTSEQVSQRSLAIARRQLAAGQGTALAVLGAEATEHQSQLARQQALAARYDDVAALFQALGGGWWNSDAPALAAAR
ncbi:MAG TPA: efflux transporter outer membrane subunit [Caulobacteraceae bacterium]|nr:efflux transporter outer membrane subunit [Caulobacteraceae bacterium]